MKRSVLCLLVLVTAACKRDCPTNPPPAPGSAAPPAAAVMPGSAALPASPDKLPPGVNAVQNEMRLLHEAMRDSVSALALGTLPSIPERLHVVHRARELTEQAVESGTYTLPKNAGQLEAFKALDESFHAELEKLATAAGANDPVGTATQLGVVLARCEGCHTLYRAAK